ncbi:Lrp/AsnC family transcriptional regulator [uncultured Pseudomonas sp.]|uniref:Lrp/AsnC family transcriptional regulator n=1 Tax=uncultured Pseudomonas sp. TaxID=114707 RepID=UPI002805C721|nr:Lrp/AsnC family transcriptional regulator [uncultured Pseudomonas sp.]
MAKIKLDATDRRLLAALQRNARLSSAELAELVSLSASPCWRRVKRLEEAGVVRGYHASIDAKMLGYSVRAFVQVALDQKDTAHMQAFEASLSSFEQVIACHCISGAFDYQLTVLATDMLAFSEFARQHINGFPGVKDVYTAFVVNEVKAVNMVAGLS